MGQPHYAVETKVRPYANIVEVGFTRGLEIAAIVYGDTKAEAEARAGLVATFLREEATPKYIRRRLRMLSMWYWLHAKSRKCRSSLNIWELGVWLIASWLEPARMLAFLNQRMGGKTTATIVPREEAT